MRTTLLLLSLLGAGMAYADSPYLPTSPPAELGAKEMRLEALAPEPLAQALSQNTTKAMGRYEELALDLGVAAETVRVDLRSGRLTTLLLSEPMVPGIGKGNQLSWNEDLKMAGAPQGSALAEAVVSQFRAFLERHADALQVDVAETDFQVGLHGDLIQLYAARVVDGVPVRGAGVTASISHGNLVLFGTTHWADIEVTLAPTLDPKAARQALFGHLGTLRPMEPLEEAHLELLPISDDTPEGPRYAHRLVWTMSLEFPGVASGYRASVDAHTGEVVELKEAYHAQTARNVKGGVFPISNDGIGEDGLEVAGFPMPFTDVTHSGGSTTADAGGNVLDVDGQMTTELAGPYVVIDDFCGAVSESSDSGDLDLGISGGTDCTTPPGGSAGNTHASRTSFYELNRIAESARGQLPSNTWVRNPLTAEVNISVLCNAFWTGTVVQFFRSNPVCANLGELAGVIDHEWGHGMDDNGTNGSISNPGEGIADVYAALRINDSCPGRGALASTCGGYGDPCSAAFGCTAARDIDWMRHDSQQPHNIAWANANCGSSPHCRGMLNSEATWDLLRRDLPMQYGYDNNTALEVTTRLTYLGADNVGSWFVQNNGEEGGCAADSGYMQYLVADDDNGDLGDGTPHMQGIFDAFDRHGIACNTPTVQDSGCAGGPTVAPTVAALGADRGASLSWNSISGATRYKIFRTDGVHQCDLGKAIVGETTDTSFEDAGLQNGREYYYVVAGFGASDACMGPTSACATAEAGDDGSIFADGFESGDTSAWN